MKPIICIIGVSGSGKSTIVNRLERKYGYKSVRSYTTRPIRENDDKDIYTHTFISSEEVENYKDNIVAYNKYNGYEYFATQQQIDEADLYVTDIIGLCELKEKYQGCKTILSFFIDCDSSIVAKRMADRGDSDEQIMKRLDYDSKAFKDGKHICDFIFTNENRNQMNDIVDYIALTLEHYNSRIYGIMEI